MIVKRKAKIVSFKKFSRNRGLLAALLLSTVLLFALVKSSRVTAGLGFEEPSWSRDLPTDMCYGTNHPDCHLGSPVTALIDSDDKKDIIAVTNNGHIIAVRHDGQLLWDTDIAPFFGMAPGTHEIHSSPAVADIDNDGFPEVVVGAGTLDRDICTQGGLIVVDHLGRVEPGWPYLSIDGDIPPAGCHETIISSPSVGDMDNDGDLEIVAAGFDKRVYAWHHDGTLVAGYPPDSYHRERFPTWGFEGKLGDNTWGSPAMADLDGDGYLDVIIGTGEGNYDARYGGDSGGWTCPYSPPPGTPAGYCGGSIYAFDRKGKILPGFPIYILEAIGSSPAISDITGDGEYEIFIGTGDFYYNNSPDHPTNGFRLYGFDSRGDALPGWDGGKVTGSFIYQSPSVGDIVGDSKPEIVVLAGDNKLYAWHIDGSSVNGFPMTPLDYAGDPNAPFAWVRGNTMADYDGDGKMEIIFAQGWSITVVDGTGQQLTAANWPNNTLPVYNALGFVSNTPAVDDIDGDGKLELIVTNSRINVWDLDQASAAVDWPVFKGNSARTGVMLQPKLNAGVDAITLLHQSGDNSDASTVLAVRNSGSRSFDWSATYPSDVTLTPSSGVIDEFAVADITITVDTHGMSDGVHALGNININATMEAGIVINGNRSFPIRLIVGDISRLYTPYIGK
jgi:hypothetical protein